MNDKKKITTESLDFDLPEFQSILDKSTELILNQYRTVENQKGFHDIAQKEVESWFDEKVPQQGMPTDDLFQLVEEKIFATATGNLGPHMYGYVMGGGNQMGIIGDKLTAAINQNVAKWHLSPSMTEIDKRVIQWAAEITGYGKNVGGFIGSSGSSANLDGLTVARNIFFEKCDIRNKGLFGHQPFTVYCSTETHNSIDKSIQLLGIGSNHLRKIPVNDDFTINVEALKQKINQDLENGYLPFCIVGNAGTVNTGAIDDLTALSNCAKTYKMWFHVDGCYGGLASSLNSKKQLYKGIDLADSLALDFHKWLYQPFEVGCILVKNWGLMKNAYFQKASYLDKSLEKKDGRLELNEHHFLLSRSAKSLKVWMTLKAYGLEKIKRMIQKDIDLTNYLKEKIIAAHDFELIADSPLAICCFRFKGGLTKESDILSLNEKLIPALEKDGRVFITSTKINAKVVLRACINNHRKNTASTAYLLEVIRDIGNQLIFSSFEETSSVF